MKYTEHRQDFRLYPKLKYKEVLFLFHRYQEVRKHEPGTGKMPEY